MTVTLKCDLCKKEIVLEPGDISPRIGNAHGWKWYMPSSYASQLIILEETICIECTEIIVEARQNAESNIRRALIRD